MLGLNEFQREDGRMNGRGGRQIGRSGPRIGLPVDAGRGHAQPHPQPHSQGQYQGASRAIPTGNWGAGSPPPLPDYPPADNFSGGYHASGQNEGQVQEQVQGHRLPPPPLPGEERPRRSEEDEAGRLSITKLFEHMDPQPRSYRADAYEDAQKIHHSSEERRFSPFATSAMIAGAVLSILVVFVSGFLTAVLIFGEPDAGGELAIRTSPAPDSSETAPLVPEVENNGDGIVPSATAGRTPLPAPSPEIVAAEAARQSGGQEPSISPPPPSMSDTSGGPTMPQAAPTLPVQETAIAPPSSAPPPADPAADPAAEPPATVLSDRFFLPPVKPSEPIRNAAADPVPDSGILAPPSGNYSLQFGAFRDRANAEALVREIATIARGGVVEEIGATGTTLYYVRAGAFQTRAQALEAVRALRRSTGIVTFVHANRGTG